MYNLYFLALDDFSPNFTGLVMHDLYIMGTSSAPLNLLDDSSRCHLIPVELSVEFPFSIYGPFSPSPKAQ